MPIRHYLGPGVVFTPPALLAMGQALEETTTILGIVGDERQREIVARFIVRLAGEDDSLGVVALRDRVLAALGGAEFSAAGAQQSDSHAAD